MTGAALVGNTTLEWWGLLILPDEISEARESSFDLPVAFSCWSMTEEAADTMVESTGSGVGFHSPAFAVNIPLKVYDGISGDSAGVGMGCFFLLNSAIQSPG